MVVQYLRVCQPAQETWVWFLVWRDSTYCLCTTTAEPCSLGPVLRNRSKSESHSVVSKSLRLHGLSNPWNSPGQNTGMGRVSLLQGIFPIQGSNPGIPHCRWILYQLSHKWSPRILKWVAYPFSSRPSQPRNRTGVSCIAGRFFTNWATGESPTTRETTAIRSPHTATREQLPLSATRESPGAVMKTQNCQK